MLCPEVFAAQIVWLQFTCDSLDGWRLSKSGERILTIFLNSLRDAFLRDPACSQSLIHFSAKLINKSP